MTTKAVGNYCVAIGRNALAKGDHAIALGDFVENTDDYSVKIGAQLYFTKWYQGPQPEQALADARTWWCGADGWKAEMSASLGLVWGEAELWIRRFLELEPSGEINDDHCPA
jgi:hypothetical protein